MIHGITATIYRPKVVGKDRFGNPRTDWDVTKVANVLVSPGATEDLEAARPEGVSVGLTLHFPKSYADSLRGCEIELPKPWALEEGRYRVVGDPMPYIEQNTPNAWNRPVEVEVANG